MVSIYLYVLDTLADWETGFVTAELKSGRFFRKDAERVELRTVGLSLEPVSTMGGLRVLPDCALGDIVADASSVLILPGADTWGEARHGAVIEKARELLSAGGTVCAICGATVALAGAGILDSRRHTSNGPGFLDMVAPGYKGSALYVDEPAVSDGNLITAGTTGALPWARAIIERLDAFTPDTLKYWYSFFETGRSEDFFALMNTVAR